MTFEPREETVVAVRERLKDWGFVLNEPSARELVHTMLASEGPVIEAEARQRADAALRAMRKLHSEILELIWRSAELADSVAPTPRRASPAPPPSERAPAPIGEPAAAQPAGGAGPAPAAKPVPSAKPGSTAKPAPTAKPTPAAKPAPIVEAPPADPRNLAQLVRDRLGAAAQKGGDSRNVSEPASPRDPDFEDEPKRPVIRRSRR